MYNLIHKATDQKNQQNQDKTLFLWKDGDFIDDQMGIPILTHGLHYGSAVFEGIRGYAGKAFALKDHFDRFFLSIARMGLKCPYAERTLLEAAESLALQSNLTEFYLRPILWTGESQMGISARQCDVHVALALWDWKDHFAEIHQKGGLRLKISSWHRMSAKVAPVHAKASFLYGPNVISKMDVEKAGYDDALFVDDRGRIMEGTGANIFFVKGNEIHTPVADYFLKGITRQIVIKMAGDMGLKVYEHDLFLNDLKSMDECFLTGTAYEICSVKNIEDIMFKEQKSTDTVRKAYLNLVAG